MRNDTNSVKTFVSFSLDEHLYGVDILLVREINKQLDVSTVPQAPEFIRGLINLRGQIVTVVDLKNRLGQGVCKLSSDCHNIIMKNESELSILRTQEGIENLATANDNVGLLVDAIGEMITVEQEQIESPPANLGAGEGQFITGVVKLQNQLMAILNIEKILEK